MSISLSINGKAYIVNPDDFPPDVTLNTFIREHAELHGTKFMCLEGGCGACIVTITGRHPVNKTIHTWSTNSCLTLLNMCDGWEVTTIEGLGNKITGYHPLQRKLAHMNGSQCGYCSPGFIMNMHGLLEANEGNVTMEKVENSFGGNLCRCTGYRPILDALKSFSTNSTDSCEDIEDLEKICIKTGGMCLMRCERKLDTHKNFKNGKIWFSPGSLKGVFNALRRLDAETLYMVVAGNTGHGVYRRNPAIGAYIDVNYVQELHENIISKNELILGANITLTEMMDVLMRASSNRGFEYCATMVEHIDLVANLPVRNMGTIAGNLMLKHQHREFPSDIFLLLETFEAQISVASDVEKSVDMPLLEFLETDMTRRILWKIKLLPRSPSDYIFNTYKIMPRSQNAHAYVNAGFLIQHKDNKVLRARTCFGGVNPEFVHATELENFLIGRNIFDDLSIQQAMKVLNQELKTNWELPDASPEYRKMLACGLFYKFLLSSAPPEKLRPEFESGGDKLKRELSSGDQVFDTQEDKWPLTKPIVKLEALVQCTGEAEYVNDLPYQPRQLWCAFVHATESNTEIAQIDASDALKTEGVIAFFSAKDIPGVNSFVTIGAIGIEENEEIFASKEIKYFAQPVGVVVAESFDLAIEASKKVRVMYMKKNVAKEIWPDLDAALAARPQYKKNNIESEIIYGGMKRIKGHFEMGGQYHFTMEPHTTVCLPKEDSIQVFSANQYTNLLQMAISEALNLKQNKIFVEVRRLGGGYGAKISRGNQAALACALACLKLNRPVRFVQQLESMMSSNGKRNASICDYDVAFDSKGKITKFSLDFFEDFGCTKNESPIDAYTIPFVRNCYASQGWNIKGEGVITDAPSHTWCRAPGSIEGIAMTENIMEHIARAANLDPIDVRMVNLANDSKMKVILPDFVKSVNYGVRKKDINKFNEQNRWRKRGIAISVMKFPVHYFGTFTASVSIYHHDGSVDISHGGIEMGQGLNTKVVQVAAWTLGIPLEYVSIKPTNSFNAANTMVTGGSIGSESVCSAVKEACHTLLTRMKPVRDKLNNAKWSDITNQCHQENISLIANHMYKAGDLQNYDIWGCTCTEVEVDILTGNFILKRVDILEDTGESLSPLVDVGQIEGAFMMGIGYWLHEELVYDRRNGEIKTTRTWNYKIPGVKDIPVDFRINLLQKSANSGGFLRSKATGELSICMSISALFAIRHAVDSARFDANSNENWYHLGAPTTAEKILLAAGHKIHEYTLQKIANQGFCPMA